MRKEFTRLDKIEGPLILLSGVDDASFDEVVKIKLDDSKEYIRGKVVQINEDKVVIQVFGRTTGFSASNTTVRFTGTPLQIPVSTAMIGRTFSGIGKAIDSAGEFYSSEKRNINGRPVNPVARLYPRNYIQTGISSIDCLTTLIRGQKLPIFSGNGLPHNELAAQIANQARIASEEGAQFAIVFGAMGLKHEEASFYMRSFEQSGVMERLVMYMNMADDPIIERIATPRCALTAAEYLAFEHNMHILVILTDMTNYCEALREISASREEIPGRKGYPGYMYSDLASIYERAGMMKNSSGSITQIPILSMPNDDITHPVPDLTGYITEGQIVLGRELNHKNIYPPVAILPSLSRLMKDGIGEGYTREDHADVANQIFSLYSRYQDINALTQVIGEDELTSTDKQYLEFGRKFEELFINQGADTNRDIIETLELGWELLSILPVEELNRINPDITRKYLKNHNNSRQND